MDVVSTDEIGQHTIMNLNEVYKKRLLERLAKSRGITYDLQYAAKQVLKTGIVDLQRAATREGLGGDRDLGRGEEARYSESRLMEAALMFRKRTEKTGCWACACCGDDTPVPRNR